MKTTSVVALACVAAAEAFAPTPMAGVPKLRTAMSQTAAPAEKPLPAGWASAQDPSSGNTYYYNEAGETTWEFPKTFDFAKGENKPYKNAKVKGGTVTAADTKYAQQKNPWDL